MGVALTSPFSYIYVEDAVRDLPECRDILQRMPGSQVIRIRRMRDIFDRKRQDVRLQHRAPALILAKKEGARIFPGAPVCQSFGNEHFYYTSTAMNCLYDCDYCFLKGMYPSGNLVLFLNLDDVFGDVEALLENASAYISISYDTDLMTLEPLAHQVEKWATFTSLHPDLSIEVRTKCDRTDLFERLLPCDRVIFAYTISPDPIIGKYEHGTPPLLATASVGSSSCGRLGAARAAMEAGFPVRLCFDPMLRVPGWREIYRDMAAEVKSALDLSRIKDASVGTFRISRDYMKVMRRVLPDSPITLYPYDLDDGYYHYDEGHDREMEDYLISLLAPEVPASKIFTWRK
ncbi:MAG: radical SAM protein [Lachnospiraceae bacterium]|nr:radical SAM protein [Lachnospiraceae bacterium]